MKSHESLNSTPLGLQIRSCVNLPILLRDGRSVLGELATFNGLDDGLEHFALTFGSLSGAPLVRLHSECVTGDVFGSARCDCGPQLHEALERLHADGGCLLYLRQEGRGIGLYRKVEAYRLQDSTLDTYAANRALGRGDDERDYRVAAQMLRALGLTRIQLLSNNPDKRGQLMAAGITVETMVPTGVYMGERNRRYLEAKVRQGGHTLRLTPAQDDPAPCDHPA